MIKGKKERITYMEEKRKHAKLCKERAEEEKKREQKRLLEIKDRNDILRYIKRERETAKRTNRRGYKRRRMDTTF